MAPEALAPDDFGQRSASWACPCVMAFQKAGRQAARFGGHQNEVLLRTGLLSFLIVSPFRINIVIQHSSLVLGAAAGEEEKTVHAN